MWSKEIRLVDISGHFYDFEIKSLLYIQYLSNVLYTSGFKEHMQSFPDRIRDYFFPETMDFKS